jgi:hypothetical protein
VCSSTGSVRSIVVSESLIFPNLLLKPTAKKNHLETLEIVKQTLSLFTKYDRCHTIHRCINALNRRCGVLDRTFAIDPSSCVRECSLLSLHGLGTQVLVHLSTSSM